MIMMIIIRNAIVNKAYGNATLIHIHTFKPAHHLVEPLLSIALSGEHDSLPGQAGESVSIDDAVAVAPEAYQEIRILNICACQQ